MRIITLEQLNLLILGDLILEDLTTADYPDSVSAVLEAENIQVQRQPQSSHPIEQAEAGSAVATATTGQEDDAVEAEVGHTDG